jgi:hypothetical protein
LDQILSHILSFDGVWVATGGEIVEAYRSQAES